MRIGAAARVAALVTSVLLLAGCASSLAEGQTKTDAGTLADTHSLTVDGVERSYVAHVPEGAAAALPETLPVLVVMHGAGGNGAKAEAATGLSGLAKSRNFIVVYPNGTQAADIEGQLAWNADGCCGAPRRTQVDDVGFISAMLDDVEKKFPVDASRIYFAGFSNGGMMSYRLSCELGDRVAGIAVVSGAFNVADCDRSETTDVLIIHGTGDLTVPYRGGPTNEITAARFGQWTNASVADATREWIERNGCSRFPQSVIEKTITRATYDECDDESKLEVITIAGGTHVWPLAPEKGFDASETIADFFGLGS
jgi:polyhydroxybutyrate depolymerase